MGWVIVRCIRRRAFAASMCPPTHSRSCSIALPILFLELAGYSGVRVQRKPSLANDTQHSGVQSLSARADCTNNFRQPYENSTANFCSVATLSDWPPPHTPSTTTSRQSYRTSAISSHRQVDTLQITQNGQDLVSVNLYPEEVGPGRQSKLLRAKRTLVNQARRKTDDEPKKFST